MKKLTLLLMILGAINSFALEIDSNYTLLKEEVLYNLYVLGEYNVYQGKYPNLDPWELASNTSLQLTRLLKYPQSRELDSIRVRNLKLSVSTNDSVRIRIYNFGFHCGGTRGWVDNSVMQWQSLEGELFSYNLSRIIHMNFTNLYPLESADSSKLYLLLGNEFDNATHSIQSAMVFKFSGKYFFINHRAFADEFGIVTYNTEVKYDSKRSILHLYTPSCGYNVSGSRINIDQTDTLADQKLYTLLSKNYAPEKGIDLRWNGTCFVNISPATKPE